jgi:hypothetical protein
VTRPTGFPSWVGHVHRVTVPTPSWIAPRLVEPRLEPSERAPLRVSVPPQEGTQLYPFGSHGESRPPLPADPPAPPIYPDLRAEYAAVVAQLTAAVEAMGQLRHQILEASEPQIVALACAIGERIAGRELRADPEIIVDWVHEAIAQLATDEPVVVAVSSDIASTLEEAAWTPVVSASVRIETDPVLEAGSCEVRGLRASVDTSFAGRVEAVTREVEGHST